MYRSNIEGFSRSTRAFLLASIAATIAAISCGPSNSSDAPVASVTSKVTTPATFPLKVSSNGRYLVDQNGVPFRIQGDTAWQLETDVTLSGLRTYLDDRKAKNFNTVVVQVTNPVRYVAASPAPATKGANGALPFLQNASGGTWDGDPGFAGNLVGASGPFHFDANFATPNDTYFAWIDTLVSEAASRGILIIMAPCYLGYANGATDGWWQTLA